MTYYHIFVSHYGELKMRYNKGIQTELQILTLLVKEKEYCQYDMPGRLEVSYRTILRHIKELERRRLVKVARREPSQKGGKNRKIYTVTIPGLLRTIQLLDENKELNENIDEIAREYADRLPLIFGKWGHFTSHGFREEAIFRLKFAASIDILRFEYDSHSNFREYEHRLDGIVTHQFLFWKMKMLHLHEVPMDPIFSYGDLEVVRQEFDDVERWFRMLMLDPDLSQAVEKQVAFLIREVEEYLKGLRKIKKVAIQSKNS